MIKYNIEDFNLENDEIIGIECKDCGEYSEDSNSLQNETCGSCGSNDVIFTTSHEGLECFKCHHTFDMFEECYANQDRLLMCKYCYDKENNYD